MDKRWLKRAEPPQEQVEQLSHAINVNFCLSAILIQRGIEDFDTARKFFRPELSHLHDPFLMQDMEAAVARLRKAIEENERIMIYGDYDVDGTTAVSLVYNYLQNFYTNCEVYIPDRYAEGYGVSLAGIEWAEQSKCGLIIALDCGIKSSELVSIAKLKGIDFVICDHHLPDDNIPKAVAVLDPKRKDCFYPFKELSGCGIGFKLMQAYAQRYRDETEVFHYLDLVAVSIASDIVPIVDENRVLTHFGLKKLNENPGPGLKALKDIAVIKNDLDVSGIIFTLGPRINAAGRVAHARGAVELLTARTEEEANALAEKINIKNDLRKQFDSDITEEAIAMIEGDLSLRTAKSTVLFKNTWHKGVIGIVAARCVEKYYRPTVILTESNNKITGSARSVVGFDLYNAILECSDLLEKFGGHKYAAGLTLDVQNLELFQRRFEEVVSSSITEDMLTPMIDIDMPLSFNVISPKFLNVLKQMAPFGPENPRPIFEAENVYVFNALSSFKDKHVRFLAGQDGSDNVFPVVGFDMIEHYDRLSKRDIFKMVFTVEENTFNGTTSIQLRIKDIKFL
ncbi:single-stranded-DNA-specific exonuclease RecJ [Parachryseolinea silvisoli]|jgi:single-stranded-DNA-specific exonuclease|uniref:single-stranded-DNA-specific exonuclease RecJ n=1 Tax=Parachryseolinea silvisoli TaxID=2873601 RepID=UPI002265ED08|nr:single-stranded-DNA-specific exonuclease RecJ [Parachryseolinea silvisoli]MCD9016387.1 single-stranded-DNA-specific exonuclease RecJ [Parachryseolinea silvisoli]